MMNQAGPSRTGGGQHASRHNSFQPAIPPDYCLKRGYTGRPRPEYFEDTVTDDEGIVWQPDVYPFAAAIARKLGSRRMIDVGCGRAHKLIGLRPDFATIGIDFGSNLEFCRKHHPQAQWLEADFEQLAPLPVSARDAENAIVICSDVIEHMIRPDALLEKIHHLLEHAHLAVISTPERDLTWGADHAGPPPNPCHTREWNQAEFAALLQSARLRVEYIGVTRSHDRDPARKTILAVVTRETGSHIARFGLAEDFRNWLAELNGDQPVERAIPDPINVSESPEASPRVSVIVPTYNRPEWLGETLQSVLDQTYRDFEIVVVNDAGPDVSHVIEPLNSEDRIRLITHEQNKGLAGARNTGVRAARGKYIAYLDDDDIFHPNHLATLVQRLEQQGGGVAYTDAHRALQEKQGDRYVVVKRDVPYSHDWDNDRILVHNFVPVLCFMHEKHCLDQAGWFDESLTTHEDWDLWIRMSRLFRFTHIKEVTCEFRWREDGSSMSSKGRTDFLRTADLIYKKYPEFAGGRPEIAYRRQQHLLEISRALGDLPGKPTPDPLLVSIVIPVFNRLDMTRPCIEAILRETTSGTFEIIVIDNNSTDGTREFLESEQAAGRLRTIRNASNLGFSKACNQGIRAARGGFILLLNNDTVPFPGWIDAMLIEVLKHQRVGAVGSCLLYPGGELIQHAGVRIGAGGGNIHPYHRWRLQRLDRVREARESRDCQVATAACLLIRRAVLDEVGCLDEEFINGFEDVDLCFRITQAGHRIRYCAESRLIHHESMTQGRGLHEQENYNRLNERWKSIITPDETAEATSVNVLEIQCRERLVTEPDNPRALAGLAEICKARHDLEEARQWKVRLNEVTRHGTHVPISVSIIIPVLNNLKLTKQCLASIERAGGFTLHEIIVVDNASSDGSPDFLRELKRKGVIRVIRNETNLGFARGCNQGAAEARGQFLLFLNNDTVVTPGWLDALVIAAHRPQVGVVGAKLLYPNNTIQHAGIGWINGVPDHPGRNLPALAPEVNAFRELDMVTGACFLMPRELFLQLGGFDEAYRNGVEDVDLCLRARAAGRKVVYEPRAVVYHLEGQSAGRFNHVNENLKLFFERWRSSFDHDLKFKVPNSPRAIPASKSSLLNPASPVSASVPLTISWEGSFLDYGSLSHVNRELTRELEQQPGLTLARINSGSDQVDQFPALATALAAGAPENVEITIRHSWPPNWKRPARGKLVVIQPWEFGSLPEEWVNSAPPVDEFWVYTRYVQNVYTASGIPAAKVKIVPIGIDPGRFHPGASPRKLPTTKSFKFLFVGGTIPRKGADLLLQAYLKTFTAADDVCLVIKDFGGHSFYKGQTMAEQIRQAQAQPNSPEILHLDDELAPEELPGLYTACDCLVHPYRGEGFGLPVLEAMACGLPVIVTSGGATDDFATEDVAYRIPSKRRNIGRKVGDLKLASEGWLLEPHLPTLVERMKWVFAHRDEARAKGQAASRHARGNWTWENAARVAATRLEELRAPATPAPQSSQSLPACAELASLDKARELVGRKNFQEAWTATVSALELRPFHPEAWLLLAKIALAAGDANSARACAQQARTLARGWSAPKQFLQKPLKGNTTHDWLTLPARSAFTPRLTVCLITRNEERFIDQCLKSVRPLASQIVLVDTGSTDRTTEIAKSHGAEVHTFTWCDDFSAARNVALEHARGDWVLILDADEELPPDQHAALLKEINNPKVVACRLPFINHGQENAGRGFVPRLFRNAPGAHFRGRIHEQAFPSLIPLSKSWGLEIRHSEAQLIHHGYSEQVIQDRRKIERNLRLLKQAVAESPREPHLLLNLGLEFIRSGESAPGLAKYREAFEALSAQPPAEVAADFRELLLTQFTAQLYKSREHNELLQVLSSPLAKQSSLSATLHFASGLAHFALRNFAACAEQMRACLAKRHQPALCPINTDILTAAPAHCLALSLAQTGDTKAAEQAFQSALAESGSLQNVKLDFAKFLARHDRPVDALQLLHQIVAENSTHALAWQLGGHIALGHPDFLEFARDWTGEAVKNLPDAPELLAQRGEVLFFSNLPGEAALLLRKSPPQSPRAKAILVASQLLSGDTPSEIPSGEERAISQEFLSLYRRLIAANAENLVQRINENLDQLQPILPTVTELLQAVVAEASVCAA